MAVTINSDSNTPQPTDIKEEQLQIQNDNMAIDGSMQRDRMGQKGQATLTWDKLAPSDYQILIGYFTSGAAVTYNNTSSNYAGGTLSFTGLPSIQEDLYVHGNTFLRSLVAVIRSV